MFIGGLRALFMQTLHPVAMRAIVEHSDYRQDSWGRLARTSRFIAVTTFGAADDAAAAIDAVRAIHQRVTGIGPDGAPYTAADPDLLRWVHVAEVDSFLRAHTIYGAQPLRGSDRHRYVEQTAEIARRLGVIDPPTTEAGLAEALAGYRPQLAGTPEARAAVRYLLLRVPLPIAARGPYSALALAAVGLMPRWSRRPLHLPWAPICERTAVRALGAGTIGAMRWAMSPPHQARAAAETGNADAAEPD
jgi:uncharacterized protein (DUF2236 family)